ncbi:Rieske (2Fe-2S) protein [Streptomyces sp. 8L]|uniref:Rieske (2Fe-2S) protein n=1 Tax=Streptomyces sp. 8L TaxID=2877242 RepID=UPI001CD5BB9D|nr:Rieske (2Fe-2S) protein [Streptomyces sp. 8L]MCA1217888.1 Rieske (2Fe-2S) protein [Streptomyces sp. 8L]
MRFVVGAAADLPPGSSRIVYPDKVKSGVGVFNIDGEYYALKNTCPHMGGPLCKGRVRGTSEAAANAEGQPEMRWVRQGEIVSCPWHHWEFDIKSGRTIFTSRQKVRGYPVEVVPADVLQRLKEGVETVPVSVEGATVVIDV